MFAPLALAFCACNSCDIPAKNGEVEELSVASKSPGPGHLNTMNVRPQTSRTNDYTIIQFMSEILQLIFRSTDFNDFASPSTDTISIDASSAQILQWCSLTDRWIGATVGRKSNLRDSSSDKMSLLNTHITNMSVS